MASFVTVSRKRKKAPLTSDSNTRCPAKRSLTQPSLSLQSQLSTKPATSVSVITTPGVNRTTSNGTELCDVCKQLTSTTSIGVDSLKCCACGLIYHGECLSIDSKILPYLYVVVEVGGWCCTRCRVPSSSVGDAKNLGKNSSTAGSNLSQVSFRDLKADLDVIKAGIRTLNDDMKRLPLASNQDVGQNGSARRPYSSVVVQSRSKSLASISASQTSTTDATDSTTNPDVDLRSAVLSTIQSE